MIFLCHVDFTGNHTIDTDKFLLAADSFVDAMAKIVDAYGDSLENISQLTIATDDGFFYLPEGAEQALGFFE